MWKSARPRVGYQDPLTAAGGAGSSLGQDGGWLV